MLVGVTKTPLLVVGLKEYSPDTTGSATTAPVLISECFPNSIPSPNIRDRTVRHAHDDSAVMRKTE